MEINQTGLNLVTNRCPLGEDLQKYWDRLSPKEREMQLDREALYSLSLQSVAQKVALYTEGEKILDGFCGAGGNAIAFALSGKKVHALDLNPQRLEMAKFNATLFGVGDAVSFELGDYSNVITSGRGFDTVFLDMPWGGPDYWRKERFALSDFATAGDKIISAAFTIASEVVIKLPKNFDFNELLGRPYEFHHHEDLFDGKLVGHTAYLKKSLNTKVFA